MYSKQMIRVTNIILISMASIIPLVFTSCVDSASESSREVRGDPQIVAVFDFGKAWQEAKPTFGQIIELKMMLKRTDTTVRYARSGHDNTSYPQKSGYDYWDEVRSSEGLRPTYVSTKCIINDLGDTIMHSQAEMYTSTGTQTTNAIIHVGLGMVYSNTTTYGGESSLYLIMTNNKPYDLMKTMKSTYRSIKYLKTIYADSLVPFKILKNDLK